MKDKCVWQCQNFGEEYDYCIYETSCDNAFSLNEGLINDLEFKFCPYCGNEIEEKSDQ